MFSLALICLSDRRGAARNVSYPHVMSDTQGVGNLKTMSHLFSQVLECHKPLHTLTLSMQTTNTWWSTFNFLLIFMTLPNYTVQKMKRSGGYPNGSHGGLPWLGGLVWRSLCFTSRCVPTTPFSLWTMNHSGGFAWTNIAI